MNRAHNPASDRNDLPTLGKIQFGKIGLMISRLSFGTGTNGWRGHSAQSRLGVNGLVNLLKLGYDHGLNFWDSADEYGTHPHLRTALQSIPRDQVVITTKTMARNGKKVTGDVDRFLREINTDVIDIVLLHVMTQANWPRHYVEVMEALTRAKEKGKVRLVGASCHSLKALQAAAESDWTEVVLARINYAGTYMDASPAMVVPILKQMYATGKVVYGMKVLGCGALTKDVRRALAYVFQLGTVHAVTIGMTSERQLMENIRFINEFGKQYPLQDLT
jgi:aryl-alcohol dehydrogenase-like predicted oxidoreductase